MSARHKFKQDSKMIVLGLLRQERVILSKVIKSLYSFYQSSLSALFNQYIDVWQIMKLNLGQLSCFG